MAYLRIVRPPTVTAEIYDAVTASSTSPARHPLGLMLHAAGEVDGCWQIVEMWYSQEYAQRFDLDRLVPAIEAVTGARLQATRPMFGFDVHTAIIP